MRAQFVANNTVYDNDRKLLYYIRYKRSLYVSIIVLYFCVNVNFSILYVLVYYLPKYGAFFQRAASSDISIRVIISMLKNKHLTPLIEKNKPTSV